MAGTPSFARAVPTAMDGDIALIRIVFSIKWACVISRVPANA
jgi:hypothetical protein